MDCTHLALSCLCYFNMEAAFTYCICQYVLHTGNQSCCCLLFYKHFLEELFYFFLLCSLCK
uniref:Uncharacterized protein n=1 Tax=Anguilla anguilla TaxID=7936 RepID=A0A0E9V6V3_ANGAN